MTEKFPPYQTLQRKKRPVLEKPEYFPGCVESVWNLTTVHGGIMANNETHSFMEILKSFNLGECVYICFF